MISFFLISCKEPSARRTLTLSLTLTLLLQRVFKKHQPQAHCKRTFQIHQPSIPELVIAENKKPSGMTHSDGEGRFSACSRCATDKGLPYLLLFVNHALLHHPTPHLCVNCYLLSAGCKVTRQHPLE